MTSRGAMLTAVVLALVSVRVEHAEGEWVQVAVIDRGPGPSGGTKQHQGQQQAVGPLRTTTSTPRPGHVDKGDEVVTPGPPGPPGPSVDDVITIRRVVGDSFSNKESVVLAPHTTLAHGDGGAEAVVEVNEFGEVVGPGVDAGAEGGVLPLPELREAHETLLEQSTAPVSGKLHFLRRLKNRLLRHIASLVPLSAVSLAGHPDGADRSGRAGWVASDSEAEGRGHKGVGFPSNEGTLMSLAFLVFAVFLVKVVMQLIYAVQNSQANNNAGVRVAQMQIPDAMVPGAMNMMGTMMNMVPAMMPPMMAAMNPGMTMRTQARQRRDVGQDGVEDHVVDADVDRMATRVLEAIDRARSRLNRIYDD